MIFDRSDADQPHYMQALVPMVDLFAVLAIVFMIYSNQEITVTKLNSDKMIKAIVAEVQEAKKKLAAIDETERARIARRQMLAEKASKSLEQIKEERERETRELMTQFKKLMAAQQNQAAMDYEDTLARIESKFDQELEETATSLEKEKQAELEKTKAELEKGLESKKSVLEQQQEKRIKEVKEELEKVISSTEMMLANTQDALVDSEQKRVEELARQKAELEKQKQLEVARTQQALTEQAEREAAKLKKEKVLALANAEQERLAALSKAEKERLDALAKQQAELESQRQLEVAKKEQALKEQAAREAEKLRKEKELALAKAEQERLAALSKAEQEAAQLKKEKERALAEAAQKYQGDLAAQKSALENEKAKALSEKEKAFADKLDSQKKLLAKVADELTPYVKALEAKKKIVEGLNENFKDFDPSAVEIDKKTGKVKLHFQKSYFVRGSHKLSKDMKNFLRIVIPKYAKAIYENKDAAEQVKSLKISGMTSPVYGGVYIDINDKSSATERARQFNMDLSTKRAKALYDFIFDKKQMGDFEFRSRLKADMSIEAVGFKHAAPVPQELVGKPAKCIKYDCKQWRATVLQFQVFSDE
jgi:hypothetical protein